MDDDRIDIPRSFARALALFGGAWAFVAIGAALIYLRPRGLEPGSFKEIAVFAAMAFFALCGVVAGARLFRSGPVVSIGAMGVFDRRLSTDWISWDAIPRIGFATIQKQRMLVLEPAPGKDAELPLTSSARRLAKANAAFTGVYGYWVSGAELKGGFPALEEAVSRFLPERT